MLGVSQNLSVIVKDEAGVVIQGANATISDTLK